MATGFIPYKAKESKVSIPTILDIVEQLKKTLMNVSLWDILTILEKKYRLWEALDRDRKISAELATVGSHTKGGGLFGGDKSQTPMVLTNEGLEGTAIIREDKLKPNPFFLTLIVGDKFLHNTMIDSVASTTVMPKQIAEVLNLKYDPMSRGVMQLDGNRVQTVGIIKTLLLTLFACPSIIVTQEVVVMDIPPVFCLCLSQDFTAKVDWHLSLYWSHLILRTKHGAKLKILFEPLYIEHIGDETMINFESTHTSI